jgi:hypothetical protein
MLASQQQNQKTFTTALLCGAGGAAGAAIKQRQPQPRSGSVSSCRSFDLVSFLKIEPRS